MFDHGPRECIAGTIRFFADNAGLTKMLRDGRCKTLLTINNGVEVISDSRVYAERIAKS